MQAIRKYFGTKNCLVHSMFPINDDLYSSFALERLKLKAIELGIKVPECLNKPLEQIVCSNEFNKYSYTTFADFYALELPKGITKTVREYILSDLFKGEDKIVFSASMMKENGLELKEYTNPSRHFINTHYIDYKGIRFLLNLHHLKDDLSLETDHIIIFLQKGTQFQRPYQFVLSTTKTEKGSLERYHAWQQKREYYDEVIQSPEVKEMIQAIINAFGQKKRLIVAPEKFLGDWRLFWGRVATAEELFEDEPTSYIGLTTLLADFFPNTVLMYATSAYGLVDRYEPIKAYKLSASRAYCGNAENSKLTFMSATELREWSNKITNQINQVVADQDIDEVYLYLYKGYMKHLNTDNKWYEPLKDIKPQSMSNSLASLECFVDLLDYFDKTFLPKLEATEIAY